MTVNRSTEYLLSLLHELRKLPRETEWVEFKHNNDNPEEIGEYLSALANTAALLGKVHAYLVWDVDDNSHDVIGTEFDPSGAKIGGEELESWLLHLLAPKINFHFHCLRVNEKPVVLLEIGAAFRYPVHFKNTEFIRVGSYKKKLKDFPELAVRELVANALIHQDFFVTGAGPMVEIFDDRMEVTNPGEPLVDTLRFVDTPPKSRNEVLASLMRRFRICEERGSGIDKVIFQVELFQLPAPLFEVPEGFTRAVLFAHRPLNEMDRADRVRACYLHACLKWVMRDYLSNSSLRERFGIEEKNKAAVSRYIREAVEDGRIKPVDKTAAKKMMKYAPY